MTREPRSTADQACPFAGESPFAESAAVREVAAAVRAGERLDREQAALLYAQAGLFRLGELAHAVRLARRPADLVTYVVDRNINYSNICVCGCRFCAFFRPPGHPEGYVLARTELAAKLEETVALGGRQVLLQGGHHPELRLSFYEDMLRFIKGYRLHIHAFSPPEIVFFSQQENLSVAEVLTRLRAAGLDSIPGGGAEILVDAVRERISPRKCPAHAWLGVMETAHRLGLRTTATMMFGHVETPAQRLEHLFALRDVQDRTGGFTAFIPWTFQPANTALDLPTETSVAYLRLLALSRLVLDNIDNIQASWVTMGPKVAQLALFFGANDFGSTMIEENVVAAAGVRFGLSEADMRRVIEAAGFVPCRRTMDYRPVEAHEDRC